MQPRTRRQKDVLEFIKQYIENHGFEPSYQQIARHLGVSSKAGIAKHIAALESQGLLLRSRETGSFKLQLNPTGSVFEKTCEINWAQLPFRESNEPSLFVPMFMVEGQRPEKMSLFRIEDDSMIDKQICRDDIAIVEKRSYSRDGEVVLAVLEKSRALLHTYHRAGANVELRPSNGSYLPQFISADKVEILGVLRGILRHLR